jgi:hypothetical protein
MKRADRIVVVKYKQKCVKGFSSGGYYFSTDIKGLKKGDLVVTDTQYGPELAKVYQVYSLAETRQHCGIIPHRRVIAKVDMDEYTEQQERLEAERKEQARIEKAARERKRKLQKIENEMIDAVAQNPVLVLKAMAKVSLNPKLEYLLAKYNEVRGDCND